MRKGAGNPLEGREQSNEGMEMARVVHDLWSSWNELDAHLPHSPSMTGLIDGRESRGHRFLGGI